jgi:hypothetical protein
VKRFRVADAIRKNGIEAAVAQGAVAQFIRASLDLSKAADIARVAQDAAVISGMNSTETFDMITLGIVKMNTEILRTAGITVDANVAYAEYAKSVKKSAASLTSAEKQQALMNAVLKQGGNIAGAYAAAMQEPGKVLRSFPRYFNDIFVAIGGVLKPLFGKVVIGAAEFLKKLTGAVSEGGALYPVLVKLTNAFEPLITDFMRFVSEVDFAPIAAQLMKLATWLQYNIPRAMKTMTTFWVGTLRPALVAVWGWMSTVLFPFFAMMFNWIGQNAPAVLLTLAMLWTTVLWPALLVVWGWMSTVLFPFLLGIYNWLQLNAPIAIQFLANVWSTYLWPAMLQVWAWMQGTLFPFLMSVYNWLQQNAPVAIQALADFWEKTLWPTLQKVWGWMSTILFPFLRSLFGVWLTGWGIQIRVFAGLWTNYLWPALQGVWAFLSAYIIPAILRATFIMFPWRDALYTVSGILQMLAEKLNQFNVMLQNMTLPSWLTPGSPTPFEMGLRGIDSALNSLNGKNMPAMKANLELTPSAPMGLSAPMGAGSRSGGSVTANFYLNGELTGTQRKDLIDASKQAAMMAFSSILDGSAV